MYDEENPRNDFAAQISRLQARNNLLEKRNRYLREQNADMASEPLVRTRDKIKWNDLAWYSKLTDTDKDHRIFTRQFVKAKVNPRGANIAVRHMMKLTWKPKVSKSKSKKKSKKSR